MSASQRGHSLSELMIGLFAFTMILASIMLMLNRWQQTTSVTRTQRELAVTANAAMQQIMSDVREASYIYHWAELDVRITTAEIPRTSMGTPYQVVTGYGPGGPNPTGTRIPAISHRSQDSAVLGAISSTAGGSGGGLGEPDLARRLAGDPGEVCKTLALVSLSAEGLNRPRYVVYFAAEEPASASNRDDIHHVFRLIFWPTVDAPADNWYPMNRTFAQQAATGSLIIRANAGNTGTIQRATGATAAGRWQLKKLFTTVNRPPADARDSSREFADSLFFIRQLHPWSDETPISPLLVEATVVPAVRYGGKIFSFPMHGRAFARNVAMPSTE